MSVEGTGNIEEVVLASCTPPLERSAFPPLLIPVFSPRYHSPSPEPALADFTGLETFLVDEDHHRHREGSSRIFQRNEGEKSMGDGKGRRGFDCAEKKYLSPVTSQQFDLTGASWSTPLTPSNHFLAAR